MTREVPGIDEKLDSPLQTSDGRYVFDRRYLNDEVNGKRFEVLQGTGARWGIVPPPEDIAEFRNVIAQTYLRPHSGIYDQEPSDVVGVRQLEDGRPVYIFGSIAFKHDIPE